MMKYSSQATGQTSDTARAQADADGDGMTKLQACVAGTGPVDANSCFAFRASW
jgi:hypothetical protein